jgi:hypothetical protein
VDDDRGPIEFPSYLMEMMDAWRTSAIAALNTDRQFICIERDETIFAIAEKRIADLRQAKAAQSDVLEAA